VRRAKHAESKPKVGRASLHQLRFGLKLYTLWSRLQNELSAASQHSSTALSDSTSRLMRCSAKLSTRANRSSEAHGSTTAREETLCPYL